MSRTVLTVAASAALVLSACAAAPRASAPRAISGSTCFNEVALTPQLVKDALDAGAIIGPSGADGRAAYVIGSLYYLRESIDLDAFPDDAVWGAAVFARDGAGWRALVQASGESDVATYALDDGASLVVTQLQIEGPGQQFTVARSNDGWRSHACAELPFPADLNAGSWMNETLAPEGLVMNAAGRGALYASGEVNTDTDTPVLGWWRYDTRDGGTSWSAPVRLDAAPTLQPDATPALERSDAIAEQTLINDLKAFAAANASPP